MSENFIPKFSHSKKGFFPVVPLVFMGIFIILLGIILLFAYVLPSRIEITSSILYAMDINEKQSSIVSFMSAVPENLATTTRGMTYAELLGSLASTNPSPSLQTGLQGNLYRIFDDSYAIILNFPRGTITLSEDDRTTSQASSTAQNNRPFGFLNLDGLVLDFAVPGALPEKTKYPMGIKIGTSGAMSVSGPGTIPREPIPRPVPGTFREAANQYDHYSVTYSRPGVSFSFSGQPQTTVNSVEVDWMMVPWLNGIFDQLEEMNLPAPYHLVHRGIMGDIEHQEGDSSHNWLGAIDIKAIYYGWQTPDNYAGGWDSANEDDNEQIFITNLCWNAGFWNCIDNIGSSSPHGSGSAGGPHYNSHVHAGTY